MNVCGSMLMSMVLHCSVFVMTTVPVYESYRQTMIEAVMAVVRAQNAVHSHLNDCLSLFCCVHCFSLVRILHGTGSQRHSLYGCVLDLRLYN